jgi:hypothetical protein
MRGKSRLHGCLVRPVSRKPWQALSSKSTRPLSTVPWQRWSRLAHEARQALRQDVLTGTVCCAGVIGAHLGRFRGLIWLAWALEEGRCRA